MKVELRIRAKGQPDLGLNDDDDRNVEYSTLEFDRTKFSSFWVDPEKETITFYVDGIDFSTPYNKEKEMVFKKLIQANEMA